MLTASTPEHHTLFSQIFDPDFYPAVDFDQHDIVSRGMSISSLNMLQSLRPQRQMNVYVEEGQVIEEKASLQKSKQLEDSNGSDDSKSSISVVLGLIPYDNNDAHHSQSEVVEDHVSLHFENIIDEVSSVYMDSDASSERSYKVQSSDNHETMPGAKSESLSGDNTSVATEVMCDEGQTGDDDHSISLHNDKVHPSNEYMPSNAFCTPDIPVDFEGTPTFNEFDLDVTLNDEHYNNHNKLSSNLATYDQELCQRPFSGEDDATLCHACKIEDPLSTLTNSYIILHPPVETALVQDVDCLEALDYLSAMPLPNEEGYSHCSTATSVSSTSSPVKTDINLDTSLHNCCSDADPRGYIPSEALTRKILVPGGLASPLKLDSGFTVHLDFDDGRKLSPIVQVYPESDLA